MGAANQRLSGNQIRLKLNQEPWVAMVSGTDRVYKLRLSFLDPDRTKDGVGEWMLDDGFYCYSESRGVAPLVHRLMVDSPIPVSLLIR